MDVGNGSDDEPQVEANNPIEAGSCRNQPPSHDDYKTWRRRGASSSNQPPMWDEYLRTRMRDDSIWDNMFMLTIAAVEESALPVFERMPEHHIGLRGRDYIIAILNGHPNNCWNLFQMEIYGFEALCNILRANEYLTSTREVSVEEALAMFAYTVAHAKVQRITADWFQHSTEIVNRHVYAVMVALCNIAPDVIAPTHTTGVAPYIQGNPKHYPWFEATNAYLSRHQQVSQNVLAACDFDMKFTFIYAGWEGTAHDARLFMDALSLPGIDFSLPPEGYYYLVDSAFPCTRGFMPLYPRVRYHRFDRHSNSSFSGYQDYFNYRHSSLRNVIERTFGVLKKRFRILKSMNPYKVTQQRYIAITCCVMHNIIRSITPNDKIWRKFNNPNLAEG
ncbi:uncharacterized protein LOC118349685 [Juglans regia]|uniref:Uncharacterized protein LOC118349685 n=1 Tax=Juglans regia TaxID=51240 RepID=A0A6P9EV46_JUGRE|nr:uncharacterized protein LOC118349685 [Juglans regia]